MLPQTSRWHEDIPDTEEVDEPFKYIPQPPAPCDTKPVRHMSRAELKLIELRMRGKIVDVKPKDNWKRKKAQQDVPSRDPRTAFESHHSGLQANHPQTPCDPEVSAEATA